MEIGDIVKIAFPADCPEGEKWGTAYRVANLLADQPSLVELEYNDADQARPGRWAWPKRILIPWADEYPADPAAARTTLKK